MRRPGVAIAILLGLLAAQGCASPPEPEPVAINPATGLPTGPIDTGTYPDLNIRPTPANTQFTPTERAQNARELTALRAAAQRAPTQRPADIAASRAQLEKSKTRGDEVLKAIEGETE